MRQATPHLSPASSGRAHCRPVSHPRRDAGSQPQPAEPRRAPALLPCPWGLYVDRGCAPPAPGACAPRPWPGTGTAPTRAATQRLTAGWTPCAPLHRRQHHSRPRAPAPCPVAGTGRRQGSGQPGGRHPGPPHPPRDREKEISVVPVARSGHSVTEAPVS